MNNEKQNYEQDKMKALNIENEKGQDYIDKLILEQSKTASKELKEEAETTRRANEILKELKENNDIKKNIEEISKRIAEQLGNIRYFSANSIYQPDADRYVKEADQYVYKDGKYVKKDVIKKIAGQVAKQIAEETMENMIQEAETNNREKDER